MNPFLVGIVMVLAITSPSKTESTTGKSRPSLEVSVQGVKPKIPRSVDLNVVAVAKWSGPSAALRFLWKSVEGPPLPRVTDLTSSMLSIPATELRAGGRYRLQLRVVAEWKNAQGEARFATASRDVAFEVNVPPRGGKCTLEARRVGAREAMLTLAAAGWQDDDELEYLHVLVRNGRETLVRDWSSATQAQTVVALRSRDSVRAKCAVRDKLRDSVTLLSGAVLRTANDWNRGRQ